MRTAWSSAATFRNSDHRGGSNGARLRLAPQKDWEVNNPRELVGILETLEQIQSDFNDSQTGDKKVSLADLIVLGGCAAIEAAAAKGGYEVQVPFSPGRTDASQEQTDAVSFAVLEANADGFVNFTSTRFRGRAEEALVNRANLLALTAPEMTVLVGGLRVLNANYDTSQHGVLTKRPGTLTNDFFVNLLSMRTEWKPSLNDKLIYEGRDRETGEVQWSASPVDLLFGSNSQLRAIAEVYASDDSKQKFVDDFVSAWTKVMNH